MRLTGMSAFCDFLDDLFNEGVKIVGRSRSYNTLIGNDRFIDPVATGVFQVGFDRTI
jgi:hypothetical protein